MLSAVTLLACIAAQAGASAAGAVADPGALDPAFGGASHGRVTFDLGGGYLSGIAAQPGGGIVTVGGDATVRFRGDGTRDPRFGAVQLSGGLHANAAAVVARSDGKVLVAGTISGPGAASALGVWRLDASGALDTSFAGGNGFVYLNIDTQDSVGWVGEDSHHRIVVVGTASTIVVGAIEDNMVVARFTSAGEPDPTFNNGQSFFALTSTGQNFGESAAVQPDDKIVVTGVFDGAIGLPVLRVTPGTLTTPAALDQDFGGGDGKVDVVSLPQATGSGVSVDSRGRILVLGYLPSGGLFDSAVVRLTPTGDVDPEYGAGAASGTPGVALLHRAATHLFGYSLTSLASGGVAVVGDSDTTGVTGFVAKLRPSGAPDRRLGPGGIELLTRDGLYAAVGLGDGRIAAAGYNPARTRGVVYRFLGDLKPPSCAEVKATITGTKGPDRLVGTAKADVIAGLGGNDRITGLGKGDIVCGGAGNDHIAGGRGGDHLYGGTGRDTLLGGQGVDALVGGPGRDTLRQ